MLPCPAQDWHRPPAAVLKEKRAAEKPRARASGVAANTRRISSHNPRKVAGTLRGVRPMGDWSTASTRRSPPRPESVVKAPGGGVTRPSAARTAGKRTCRTRVLLPLPETPATTVSRPNGRRRSTPARLLALAPRSSSHAVGAERAAGGGGGR